MANICSDCGFNNDEGKLFCGACGEPLAGDAKLLRDMEKMKAKREAEAAERERAAAQAPEEKDDAEDYTYKKLEYKKDNTDFWLIVMALFAFLVLCLCGWYYYEHLMY